MFAISQGYPGFFAPWNLVYIAIAIVSHALTTPKYEDCKEFEFAWINQLFWRNQILLWMIAGGWHLTLFTFKLQPQDSDGREGMEKKYDKKWPGGGAKFMFGHQTYENVFMSCTSGVLVWTAYEAIFMKLWANDRIPFYTDPFDYPVWTVVQFILIPFWREFHFYWTHRMIHWKPLYKHIHYLHHKNVNPGEWVNGSKRSNWPRSIQLLTAVSIHHY
jgi:sterol desaturase/sphingolipid hydroxylase (fatty acid hydroxylase superfamily)